MSPIERSALDWALLMAVLAYGRAYVFHDHKPEHWFWQATYFGMIAIGLFMYGQLKGWWFA